MPNSGNRSSSSSRSTSQKKKVMRSASASAAKVVVVPQPPSARQNLRLYQKSYKGGGMHDIHYRVFQQVQVLTQYAVQKVLYPGCHRHLTASLIFPDVTYIDCDKRVASLYDNGSNRTQEQDGITAVRDYINSHKVYDQDTEYQFYGCNIENEKLLTKMLTVSSKHNKKKDSGLTRTNSSLGDVPTFDLLISLSSGRMAAFCDKFVHTGSYLLINDAHSDARSIFVDEKNGWELVAYWDSTKLEFTTEHMDRCFQAVMKTRNHRPGGNTSSKKAAVPITPEQVQESIDVGAVSKRSFKLLLEPDFFLFRMM
jgi:hypothetical protein